MKKVFGQTVRDLKREVNKKVRKVSEIEQKVLEATSNESWGPHGTHLTDIAAASRDYQEYQIIMAVIWKRINDNGKNWRHVYKALIILEYLVANGTERVIDEIREHAHQISTLADFQYIDSNGRDQGGNVRRKSQSLVMLVNDKELIMEIRQKAASCRDKLRNASPGSGMYRPGGYEDDQYSCRDDYGYGRDKEGRYRDDERSTRNGDSYSQNGDCHTRDSEEGCGREGVREDDFQNHQNGSKAGSIDGDRSPDDGGQYSARDIDRKFSVRSINGPPSYEEVVGEGWSPENHERDQEAESASVPKPSSSTASRHAIPTSNEHSSSISPAKQAVEGFDGLDPRVLAPGPAATKTSNADIDLLRSFSDSPMGVPAIPDGPMAGPFPAIGGFGTSDAMQQPFDDPFGDGPFKAIPDDNSTQAQAFSETSSAPFTPCTDINAGMHQQTASVPDFGFGDSLSALTYPPSDTLPFPAHDNSNPEEEIDILAGILPPTRPSAASATQTPVSDTSGQHLHLCTTPYGDFMSERGHATSQVSHADMQFNQGNFYHTSGNAVSHFSAPTSHSNAGPFDDFGSQAGLTTSVTQNINHQTQIGTDWSANRGYFQQQAGPWPGQSSSNSYGDFGLQVRPAHPTTPQVSPHPQAGTEMQFNQGNFQQKTGTTFTPFSAESQNGQVGQINDRDLVMPAGLTTLMTSITQASSAMGMPFSNGNLQNQAGPLASPFSSHSHTGVAMQPSVRDIVNHDNFQSQTGPSASPFSTQSQSGLALQPNIGNFGSSPGRSTSESSQMSSQAQAGMNTPFNHGNFPDTGPSVSQSQNLQALHPKNGNFGAPSGSTVAGSLQMSLETESGMIMPYNHENFPNQIGPSASSPYSVSQSNNGQPMQPNSGAAFQHHVTPFGNGNLVPPGGSTTGSYSQNAMSQTPNGPTGHLNNNFFQQQVSGHHAAQPAPQANRDVLGNMIPQTGMHQSQVTSHQIVSSSAGPLSIVPQQPSQRKFQTKSTVWADTLSRGLVDLNISGPKTNPLADIGVDFDTMNRKEKRMEKQPTAPVVSTVTMGKAMGSGSGMGRAGASLLGPTPNPMSNNMSMGMGGMGAGGGQAPGMSMGMGGMGMVGGHGPGFSVGGMGMIGGHGPGFGIGGMGMGAGPGSAMGMGGMGGGYGGMNQQPTGIGMNPGYNKMAMGMNPGMGQGGAPMQQPGVGYGNPMMGGNGYPQQHYGNGYR